MGLGFYLVVALGGLHRGEVPRGGEWGSGGGGKLAEGESWQFSNSFEVGVAPTLGLAFSLAPQPRSTMPALCIQVPMAADDLSGFIDETPLPGAPGSRLTYEQLMDSSVSTGSSTDRAMQASEKLTYTKPPVAVAPAEVAAVAPVAVPEVAAAPAVVAPVFPPTAVDGPAAELKALEAQLAALKAAAGQ